MTAEEIAAGLTDAQKSVLKAHRPGEEYGAHIWPFLSAKDPRSFSVTARPMMDLGLLEWCKDWRKTATVITSKGLAVRAILESNHDRA